MNMNKEYLTDVASPNTLPVMMIVRAMRTLYVFLALGRSVVSLPTLLLHFGAAKTYRRFQALNAGAHNDALLCRGQTRCVRWGPTPLRVISSQIPRPFRQYNSDTPSRSHCGQPAFTWLSLSQLTLLDARCCSSSRPADVGLTHCL